MKPVENAEAPTRKNWSRNIIAIAAVLVVCALAASMMLPALSKAKAKSPRLAALMDEKIKQLSEEMDKESPSGQSMELASLSTEQLARPTVSRRSVPTRAISDRDERLAETAGQKPAIFLPGQQAEEQESLRESQLAMDPSDRTYFAERPQLEQAAQQVSSQTELNRSLGRSLAVNGSQQDQWFFDGEPQTAPPPQIQEMLGRSQDAPQVASVPGGETSSRGEIATDPAISYDPASNTITVISDGESFPYIQQVVDQESLRTGVMYKRVEASQPGSADGPEAVRQLQELFGSDSANGRPNLNESSLGSVPIEPAVGFEVAANEPSPQGAGRGGRGGRGGAPVSGQQGQQAGQGQPVAFGFEVAQNGQAGQGQRVAGEVAPDPMFANAGVGNFRMRVAGVITENISDSISGPVDAEGISFGVGGGGGGFGGGAGNRSNADIGRLGGDNSGMLGIPVAMPAPVEPQMDGLAYLPEPQVAPQPVMDFDADGDMDMFARNPSSQTRGFSTSSIIDESIPASTGGPSILTSSLRSDETLEKSMPAKSDVSELSSADSVSNPFFGSYAYDVSGRASAESEVLDRAALGDDKLEAGNNVATLDRFRRSGNQFTGEVKLRISKDMADIDSSVTPSRRAELQEESDSYYVGKAIESITSDAVLNETVRRLNLVKKWNESNAETATAALKDRLELTPDSGPDDIKIGVRSESPEEAVELAETVAIAYRDAIISEMSERRLRSVEVLRGQLKEQEVKIEETTGKVDQLRETFRVNGNSNQNGNYQSAVRDLEQQTRLRDALEAKISQELKDISNASRLERFAPKISPVSLDVSNELTLPEQDPVPATPPATLEPQPEVITAQEPFSTFSLNVSDVSFKLAASSLEAGAMPDGSQLRSEEFINAFDYHDPAPSPGERIGFTWDRATYPFAQNRDLIRFSIATAAQGREAGVPLNLVLLLDNSGSMERSDRVQIINEALGILAGQLQPQDRISVVTFASSPRLVVDGLSGGQSEALLNRVVGLTPQGGTNLETALDLAYETASKHYQESGNNRVILLTDGAANLGNVNPDDLKEQVVEMRKRGIAFDCFGIGWEGYNDTLLETLSRNGDGRYGFINSPEEAGVDFADQLAGALQVAAADVKAQVEFNPERVVSYRQIGYIKHQLTKEQFRDNTVDAAEIGAAESGNALYVIQVNPNGSGPIGTARARYRVPSTGAYEEKEWTLDYNRNVMPLDQANPAMRLAATSAAFAEWLAQSPYAGEITPTVLDGYLRGVPEAFAPDSRPGQLRWMIQQAHSLTGL